MPRWRLNSACAALERLFAEGEPGAVSYAGNVFEARSAAAGALHRRGTRTAAGYEVLAPTGDSLAGAARLARLGGELRPEPGILWRVP